MKTVIIMDDRASELLLDGLNQRVVRELVFSEYGIAELSRKLNVPPLKIWRRIQKLVDAKVVEVARVDTIRNLEKKIYRATATNFVARQFLDLKPKDRALGNAFRTYLEIQGQLMRRVSSLADIPKGVDPIDFTIYAAVKSYCQVFLDPKLEEKLRRLERDIAEFEQAQKFQPASKESVANQDS